MKHHEQWEEERVYLSFVSPDTVQWRNARQEFRPGGNLDTGANTDDIANCCLLACSSWLSQLAYGIQNHQPWGCTTHNRLSPPHQMLIKKIARGHDKSLSFCKHFLNRGSLLSDYYSLCPVGIKLSIQKEGSQSILNYKILYIKGPKNSTRKHLQLKNTSINWVGYKLNPQKLVPFLYTKTNRLMKK